MKRYRFIGRPDRPVPFGVLTDRTLGEEFDAELDEATENYLVGGGALQVIGRASKPATQPTTEEKKPDAESKPAADKPGPSSGGSGDGDPKPVGGATQPAGKPTGGPGGGSKSSGQRSK